MSLSGERCGAILCNDFQEWRKRFAKHRPIALEITGRKPTFPSPQIVVDMLLGAEEVRVKRQQLFRPVSLWRQLVSPLNLLVPPIDHHRRLSLLVGDLMSFKTRGPRCQR